MCAHGQHCKSHRPLPGIIAICNWMQVDTTTAEGISITPGMYRHKLPVHLGQCCATASGLPGSGRALCIHCNKRYHNHHAAGYCPARWHRVKPARNPQPVWQSRWWQATFTRAQAAVRHLRAHKPVCILVLLAAEPTRILPWSKLLKDQRSWRCKTVANRWHGVICNTQSVHCTGVLHGANLETRETPAVNCSTHTCGI